MRMKFIYFYRVNASASKVKIRKLLRSIRNLNFKSKTLTRANKTHLFEEHESRIIAIELLFISIAYENGSLNDKEIYIFTLFC